MKERLCRRRAHEDVAQLGPGRLAADGHARGITPECANVLLHPFERQDQVAQSVVRGASIRVAQERTHIQKAENAEPIGKGDTDDALAREDLAVGHRVEGAAASEAASMNPNEDGERLAAGTFLRCPDIELQAVFTFGHRWRSSLERLRTEACRTQLALPGPLRLWSAKAQRPNRRLRKRNAAKDAGAVLHRAAQAA